MQVIWPLERGLAVLNEDAGQPEPARNHIKAPAQHR